MADRMRRGAAGLPEPTDAQIRAAHQYAADLVRGEKTAPKVSALHLAVALWFYAMEVRAMKEALETLEASRLESAKDLAREIIRAVMSLPEAERTDALVAVLEGSCEIVPIVLPSRNSDSVQ